MAERPHWCGTILPCNPRPLCTLRALRQTDRQIVGSLTSCVLKDLSGAAGMSAKKAHPYMVSFLRVGFVTQTDGGQYELGPLALQLGLTKLQRMDQVKERRNSSKAWPTRPVRASPSPSGAISARWWNNCWARSSRDSVMAPDREPLSAARRLKRPSRKSGSTACRERRDSRSQASTPCVRRCSTRRDTSSLGSWSWVLRQPSTPHSTESSPSRCCAARRRFRGGSVVGLALVCRRTAERGSG